MPQHSPLQRLVDAYRNILTHAAETVASIKHRGAGSVVSDAVEQAKERASALGELSREEAAAVGDYLLRDVHDAAEFIAEHDHELKDWLQLDAALVEDKLLSMFAVMADQTALELDKLRARAAKFGEWRAGEVTGAGTLYCTSCGESIHLHHIAHIPPCPKCRGTQFKRRLDGT